MNRLCFVLDSTTWLATLLLALALGGCTTSSSTPAGSGTGNPAPTPVADAAPSDAAQADAAGTWAVVPGTSVGPITIGATYASVRALLGSDGKASGVAHVNLVDWADRGLELVFASSSDANLSDDAYLLAIGLKAPGSYSGPAQPGVSRAAIEAALGPANDQVGSIAYWAAGASAMVDATTGMATQVAVFAPYFPESIAPEMKASQGPGLSPKIPDASAIAAVDMHLHPGFFGRIPEDTKQFIIGSIPPFTQLYAPAALSTAVTPYAPLIGIKAATAYSGVDHAVLFAVYTQKTTGWYSNEELEATLTDPRNVAPDGLPWAWGLASIDFFDGFLDADGGVDATVSSSRYAALASYFEKRRDLFIGIKLAHAHQSIAFDDPRYLGVYDVANKYGVPVYLHTGFTPFPNASETPPYYDPDGLANTIQNYPNVKFILGHVGQGDQRATDHALALAKSRANVFLEISALNLPLRIEADGGAEPDGGEPTQYPYVLGQVKALGLVSKTIFGTDGPQYDGMGKSYVEAIRAAMQSAGYTSDEQRTVMSGTFLKVFFGVGG